MLPRKHKRRGIELKKKDTNKDVLVVVDIPEAT